MLRYDGSIRFVSSDIADKDSVMKADVYHRTTTTLLYRIVIVGRTDTFEVSLKTLQGVQRLTYTDGEQEKVFRLKCAR